MMTELSLPEHAQSATIDLGADWVEMRNDKECRLNKKARAP